MNRDDLITAFLEFSRRAGLFSAARKKTANILKIICYHGFSLDDEHEYMPAMFVSEETLRSRMRILREQGYNVISLADGVDQLQSGELRPDSVVITTDDGFYGTLAVGARVFQEFGFANTLYATTFYIQHQTPIFRFLLTNMLLRSECESVELGHLAPDIPERIQVRGEPRSNPHWQQIGKALDRHYALEDLDSVFAEIGRLINVDYERLRDGRFYHLLSGDEIRDVEKLGVDIQLHTHRHQLPVDEATIQYEIERNREVLGQYCSSKLEHFCYPNGVWQAEHIEALRSLGVKSATTCEIGENGPDANPHTLSRFLDRDDISDLRFEAEISGYMPLVRRAAHFGRQSKVR